MSEAEAELDPEIAPRSSGIAAELPRPSLAEAVEDPWINGMPDLVYSSAPPEAPAAATAGVKHDGGKLPLDLLPFDALEEIAKVLRFGANKYARRNWERGIPLSRVLAATLRHVFAYMRGENKDPETGLSHLAHAGCEVLFALAFECRGRTDLDDRTR